MFHHDEFFGGGGSGFDVVLKSSEDVSFLVSSGGFFGEGNHFLVTGGGLFTEEEGEFGRFFSVESRFLDVLGDDVVVVFNGGLKTVSSFGKRVLLVGEISKFSGPSSGFSFFPSLVSSSGGSDLRFKGVDQTGDLTEKFGVLSRRSNLGEGVNEWSVSGEFVVKVGHFFELFGDLVNSSFELDEESTSSHGGEKVDGILASVDSGFMFGIESNPGGMFHVSLGLSSFDSSVNTVEFGKSGSKLFFGISKKRLGVNNGLVT